MATSPETAPPFSAARPGLPSIGFTLHHDALPAQRLVLLPTSEKGVRRLTPGHDSLAFQSAGAMYLVPMDNGVDFERVPPNFVIPVTGGSTLEVSLDAGGVVADPTCLLRLFAYDAAGDQCGKFNLPLRTGRARDFLLPASAVTVAVGLRLQGEGRLFPLALRLRERKSFAALLGVTPTEREAAPADAADGLAEGARLIAEQRYDAALAALAPLDSGNARVRRLLLRASYAAGHVDQVRMLFEGGDEALQQDPVARLRYFEVCAASGAQDRAAAILDESLFRSGTGDFLARCYPFANVLGEDARALLRARILQEFATGSISAMRALAAAHDAMTRREYDAVARFLARADSASGEDGVRIDLLAGQAAFGRGAFDRQLAWLVRAFGRHGLDAVAAIDPAAPVSPANLRPAITDGAAMPGPLVSVVIVADGESRGIAAATRSVLDQRYRELELLVAAGAHAAAEQAQAAAAGDSRLKIVSAPAGAGHWAAFEHAAASATGRFVMAHAAGGWAHPQKIERMVAAAVSQGAPAVLAQSLRASAASGFQCAADYLVPDDYGLLYAREAVADRIGGHDDVASDGEAEFLARLRRGFDGQGVTMLPDLLQIATAQVPDPEADAGRLLARRAYLARQAQAAQAD